MASYRLTPIAQLAHQLAMSPARLRLRQIEGTEYLLDLIDADKAYPYDFVCYHITGYRPRRSDGPGHGTLNGKHLVTDLVQLVEDLSASPMIDANALSEPAWSTEQLARRLRVSTKTVCRWRRRGLAGRKLRFPDGTIRVAFVERCIRRFVRRNLAMVLRGAAFKQLSNAEKHHIVERAREILAQQRIRLHELSQKIAAEMHRAVETVRYTLRRFDHEHPEEALFGKNEQPIVRPEHQALYDAYRAGESIQRLAKRLGQSVATIEQIIREIRARQLLARPLDCIYNHEFDAPNADDFILGNHDEDDAAAATASVPASAAGVPRDLPTYLRDLYREPLLTAKQERSLFRRYNYLKFKAAALRERIDPLRVTESQLKLVEDAVAACEAVKDQITRANLRLVVSIARRHVGPARNGPEFLEIVSDGNLSLMRAVEKFDYARGYKFSTYASWAIMRNYARTIPESLYHAGRLVTGNEEILETVPDTREPQKDSVETEGIRKTLERCLAQLTDRERAIVVRHFGLKGEAPPETLDQIGKGYGVTKERVRQIERGAIKRLREILLEEQSNLALSTA